MGPKESKMKICKRKVLWAGFGGIAAATLSNPAFDATVEELSAGFTAGTTPGAGGITITAPEIAEIAEIAENGNTVPVSVDAPGAVAIMLLAAGNPEPAVATFLFGPADGSQMAATRIRLAKTQNVIAMAKMPDGNIVQASATVKNTIGGGGRVQEQEIPIAEDAKSGVKVPKRRKSAT
jgi:sulfur-oxidizing protein SoxY